MAVSYTHLDVYKRQGWNSTDLFFRDETIPGSKFMPIIEGKDAIFYGHIIGETLYMITNFQASKYKIVAVDLGRCV